MKRLRKLERENKLEDHYGMQRKDLTPEERNDLVLLKMRNYLNPKTYFKSSDFKQLPKFFQVGTYIDGGDEVKGSGRIRRKERSADLVSEFLKEDQKISFSKKKFGEIQKAKQKFNKNKKLWRLKKFAKRIKKNKK